MALPTDVNVIISRQPLDTIMEMQKARTQQFHSKSGKVFFWVRAEMFIGRTSYWKESVNRELQGQFGNPQKGERQPLDSVTRRLVKTQQYGKTYVCAPVTCEVCRTVRT
jgi:hypothetical protein